MESWSTFRFQRRKLLEQAGGVLYCLPSAISWRGWSIAIFTLTCCSKRMQELNSQLFKDKKFLDKLVVPLGILLAGSEG